MQTPEVYEIPVCTRCRSKKIRCDTGRPCCSQCARVGIACEFVRSSDSAVRSSREHISALERKLQQLEIDCALSQLKKRRKKRRRRESSTFPDNAGNTLKQSTVTKLIRNYFSHCQFPYLILAEDEFTKQSNDIYSKYGDLYTNPDTIPDKAFFMTSMVIAISLLSLNDHNTPKATLLAETISTQACSRLNRILAGKKDLETLQCVLLLVLYSIKNGNDLVRPGLMCGVAKQICFELGLSNEDASLKSGQRLYLTVLSMDQNFSTASAIPESVDIIQVPMESIQEQQTMHYIRIQSLQNKISVRLHRSSISQRDSQDAEDETTCFIANMTQRLEEWKRQAQQLAALVKQTDSWWGFWYSTTVLHLNRPCLRNPIPDIIQSRRCYSASTTVIDISFANLFFRQEFPVTYSWTDVKNIILAGTTFLYIICTSKDTEEEEPSCIDRHLAQWIAVVKRILQPWPNAARVHRLLQSLATCTLDRIHSSKADTSSEEERRRSSKRPRIISSPDPDSQTSMSFSAEEQDAINLPPPVAKVRPVLVQDEFCIENTLRSGLHDREELLPRRDFVRRYSMWILCMMLGLNLSPNQQDELDFTQPSDETDDYRAVIELLDELRFGNSLIS